MEYDAKKVTWANLPWDKIKSINIWKNGKWITYVEEVHAHWIDVSMETIDPSINYQCSNCGCFSSYNSYGCPECCAIMDGKDDNNNATN